MRKDRAVRILLTGSRQKVANYAGVTVERKEGLFDTPNGKRIRVLDLPGAYSLNALSLDETITRDVVLGTKQDEERPDLLVCVTDATNLRLNLRLVVEAKRLGLPTVLALNMADVAKHRGVEIDVPALERELGMPVVQTVAVRSGGADDLVRLIEAHLADRPMSAPQWRAPDRPMWRRHSAKSGAFLPPRCVSHRTNCAWTMHSIASSCTPSGDS